MQITTFNCRGNHLHYRIVAEAISQAEVTALAGFCAAEHTENLLFRHLQNLCLQTDGSLHNTSKLVQQLVKQWQITLSLPAVQTLQHDGGVSLNDKLKSVSLYKTVVGEPEKLVHRILL